MTGKDVVPVIGRALRLLEESRSRAVVLYHSTVEEDTVLPLYRCLRLLGHREQLDVVVSTNGGSIQAARQLLFLLREFTDKLNVLVPRRARSAGTLLCLGADELVLGPLAELGPIDANMGAEMSTESGVHGGMISAEDIRLFRAMAREWFHVDGPDDGIQLLALVASRVSPTSISSLYRFDKMVRAIAEEILETQMTGEENADKRAAIIGQLVEGYQSHDAVISRKDARALGLRVTEPSSDLEELFLLLSEALPRSPDLGRPQPPEQTIGVIAGGDFVARHVLRVIDDQATDQSGTNPQVNVRLDLSWEAE